MRWGGAINLSRATKPGFSTLRHELDEKWQGICSEELLHRIPAKATHIFGATQTFQLFDEICEFLRNNAHDAPLFYLIQGDSGAGKSVFALCLASCRKCDK